MKYKITALRDVTVRAYVPFQTMTRVGNEIVPTPSEREEWISLRAGEVRENVGLVLGVHPSCLPNQTPLHTPGSPPMVIVAETVTDDDLLREFFHLHRLECQEQPPHSEKQAK